MNCLAHDSGSQVPLGNPIRRSSASHGELAALPSKQSFGIVRSQTELGNEGGGAGRRFLISVLATVVVMLGSTSFAVARDGFGKEPSWSIPPADLVQKELESWIDKQELEAGLRDRALTAMLQKTADSPAGETLVCLLRAAAIVDGRVAKLLNTCDHPSRVGPVPKFKWLRDEALSPLIRDNARLYYGRWLSQEGYYDEALDMLADLSPKDVVDPASLLFYRSVAHHRLVEIEEGSDEVETLLERADELPLRYRQLALLMQRDLAGVKTDSLDHIARRMTDIRRRLDKGRAGEKVIEVEQGVLDSLDKLIKKLEEEERCRQQQQPGSGQGGKPMQDSRSARMQTSGRVDQKNVGSRSGWGNLPDKEREEAMQQIARDFPVHYREVIEQYFRKLATEESSRQ